MQKSQLHLAELVGPDGLVSATAMPVLRELVEQYPYFHLARLMLLRILYQQRDPEFNDELRRSALYLPSRETIFNFVEADKMVPREKKEGLYGGAILSRKPSERLDINVAGGDDSRTDSLIDSFLSSITAPEAEPVAQRPAAPVRRGRVDATVDYISYMLEEESAQAAEREAAVPASPASPEDTPSTDEANTNQAETPAPLNAAPATAVAEDKAVNDAEPASGTTELIEKFIQKQGDRRIKLKDKSDSDLQKPVLDVENSQQKSAFTETLARIYIKQGKFEAAIEIIRRLSLKYPKKNRYFADQIRFLEKIIANNKAKKD
ncbi:MAG: hypothetical protein KBT39_07000 [Bacteroidales bacterium]|nr:hypothetical protein [Bacteroidales bacterium]